MDGSVIMEGDLTIKRHQGNGGEMRDKSGERNTEGMATAKEISVIRGQEPVETAGLLSTTQWTEAM